MRISLKYWIFNWIFKFNTYSKVTIMKVNHALILSSETNCFEGSCLFCGQRLRLETEGIASVLASVLMH